MCPAARFTNCGSTAANKITAFGFVNRAAGHIPLQMLLLSVISIVIGLASDTCWGLAASTVRAWFARSPRRLSLIGGAGGLAIIGLGVTLAVTGRKD